MLILKSALSGCMSTQVHIQQHSCGWTVDRAETTVTLIGILVTFTLIFVSNISYYSLSHLPPNRISISVLYLSSQQYDPTSLNHFPHFPHHFFLSFSSLVVNKQQVWSFSNHLNLKEHSALCLHRWKIWWTIPKLLKHSDSEHSDSDSDYQEAHIPPETYFLLSQFKV